MINAQLRDDQWKKSTHICNTTPRLMPVKKMNAGCLSKPSFIDTLGNLLRFLMTGGQRHDITQAEHLIANRSYDAEESLKKIAEK